VVLILVFDAKISVALKLKRKKKIKEKTRTGVVMKILVTSIKVSTSCCVRLQECHAMNRG
jgi:hypothetical protein